MARTSSQLRTVGVESEKLRSQPARSRLGRPPAHTRTEITAAAIAVADTAGLPAVTMRRVAARIGVGAMSLYTYVPDKETLLELMIDQVAGEHELPAVPSGDWRADLRDLAHAQRAIMGRHPWLPTALLSRQALGPNTLAGMEYALAVLEPTGLDGPARLEIFALLTGFIVSHVMYELAQEQATRRTGRIAGEILDAQTRYLHSVTKDGSYPRLAQVLTDRSTDPAPQDTFDRLLDRMITGLTAGGPKIG